MLWSLFIALNVFIRIQLYISFLLSKEGDKEDEFQIIHKIIFIPIT